MKRLLAVIGIVFTLSVGTPVSATPVAGSQPLTQMAVCSTGLGNLFGLQPWHACLDHDANGNPKISALTDVLKIGFPILDALLKVAFYVAAGMMFYMIIEMIRARGNSQKVATSAMGMRDAVIGLVIALISVAIVNFVSGAF